MPPQFLTRSTPNQGTIFSPSYIYPVGSREPQKADKWISTRRSVRFSERNTCLLACDVLSRAGRSLLYSYSTPCMSFQVLELWGEGDTPEEAAEAVKKFPEEIKRPFFAEEVTWSVTVRQEGRGEGRGVLLFCCCCCCCCPHITARPNPGTCMAVAFNRCWWHPTLACLLNCAVGSARVQPFRVFSGGVRGLLRQAAGAGAVEDAVLLPTVRGAREAAKSAASLPGGPHRTPPLHNAPC